MTRFHRVWGLCWTAAMQMNGDATTWVGPLEGMRKSAPNAMILELVDKFTASARSTRHRQLSSIAWPPPPAKSRRDTRIPVPAPMVWQLLASAVPSTTQSFVPLVRVDMTSLVGHALCEPAPAQMAREALGQPALETDKKIVPLVPWLMN